MGEDITVSIFMLTYNQENFIAQTIDSILMQQTNFLYQLVIGEDNSADSTYLICKAYAEKHPEKIKLLEPLGKNIGLIKNYFRTIKECTGKYIAICDGDDYWIDEFKLQKQVDFLERNKEYSIIYTDFNKLYPNGDIKKAVHSFEETTSDFTDLINNNYIHSVTVLFKNNKDFENLPTWIAKFPYGDWPTYLWLLKDGGKIYFLDHVTANYRVNIGVSAPIISENSKLLKVNLQILNCMLLDISFSNRSDLIKSIILKNKISLMTSFNREKKLLHAFVQLMHNLIKNRDKLYVLKVYIYSLRKTFL